jgi:hypothetical protein
MLTAEIETTNCQSKEQYREYIDIAAAHEVVDYQDIELQAKFLIDNRDAVVSPEVHGIERRDNARTALMEGLTAYGHLSRVEITGESLQDINAQVLARLLNGWSDNLPAHEQKRRFYELCEELVIQNIHDRIVRDELSASVAVAVISDYPELMSQKSATQLGYRTSNKKGMVRSTHLERGTNGKWVRVIEQVSRSNSVDGSSAALYRAEGLCLQPEVAADLQQMRTPLLYTLDNLADGVVDLQRRLDTYGPAATRYGEKIAGNESVLLSYEALRKESQRREQQIAYYVDRLAAVEQQLDAQLERGMITTRQKNHQYALQVQQCLRAICTLDPDYATGCFGQRAAAYYEGAAYAEARGDYGQRDEYLQRAQQNEEVVSICGFSIDAGEADELGNGILSLSNLIAEGKKNWDYKDGFCRVSSCDSRKPKPKKVKVGPCSVCKTCEVKFDKGMLK